jgi:O-antigen/teichoic acid export membrane protein
MSLIGLKLNLLTFGGPAFSIWLLLFSIWGVGTALDFGFGISTVKFVAQYKNDNTKINKIISTGFFLILVLGILIVLLGYGCAEMFYLHNTRLIPEKALSSSRAICYLSGLSFYILYVTVVFRSILEGHEEFSLTSKISMLYSLVTFSFIVAIFLFHGTIVHLAILYIVAAALQLLYYFYMFKKKYSHLSIRLGFANIHTFREIIKFSISVQITFFLGSLIDPAAKYIIGNFSQTRLIPPYEVAKRFSLAISGLFGFSFRNALPNVSKLKSHDDFIEYFFSYGVRISKLGIFYSGLFFGVLAIAFCGIFKYFYGYTESIIIFLIFALAESINSAGFIVYVFILGIGRSDFLALLQLSNVLMICLFLCIGYICFGNSVGLLGFYFSVICGNLMMLLFVKRKIGISILDYYRKTAMKKLMILNGFMAITIAVIFADKNLWFISLLILSGMSIFLFYGEIMTYRKNLYAYGISLVRKKPNGISL